MSREGIPNLQKRSLGLKSEVIPLKIQIRSIPVTGALNLEEKFEKDSLDIGGPDFKPSEPVIVKAQVTQGTNNVNVKASISGSMEFNCSRCLANFKWPFKKNVKFNYEVEPTDLFIDINPDLREETIDRKSVV